MKVCMQETASVMSVCAAQRCCSAVQACLSTTANMPRHEERRHMPEEPHPGPKAPPSTISGTPTTQNEGTVDVSLCHACARKTTADVSLSRLPRETKVDVRLCHACHAKWRGAPGAKSRPKSATQYHLSHACHAKRRQMSVCATPAT